MGSINKTHSRGRVAFSWEKKPGVCKSAEVAPPHRRRDGDVLMPKQLRPPPCSSARKGNRKLQKDEGRAEDPFLAAYRECTGDQSSNNYKSHKNLSGFGGWIKMFGTLSCKHFTAVRDDSLISSSSSSSSPVSKRTM